MLTKNLFTKPLSTTFRYSILIVVILFGNSNALELNDRFSDSEAVTNYKLDVYLKQNCKCMKVLECNSLVKILSDAMRPMSNYVKERFRKLSCTSNEIPGANQGPMACCVVDDYKPIASSEEIDFRIDLSDSMPWIWSSKKIPNSVQPTVYQNSFRKRHLDYSDDSDEFSNENFVDFEDPYTHKNCPPSFDSDDQHTNYNGHNRYYPSNPSNNFYPRNPGPQEFPINGNEYPHPPQFYPHHPHHFHHHNFHGNHFPIESRVSTTKKPRKGNTPPKKFNVQSTQSSALVPTASSSFDLNLCGVSIGSRIIGGRDSAPGQFPWLARIGYKNLTSGQINYRCIGSLINSRYILTAAHCMTNLLDNLEVSHIRFNEVDPIDNLLTPQDYQIEKLIPHQLYDRPKYANDIGLMRIKFPDNSLVPTPICLPMNGFKIADENIAGKLGVVAGWKSNQNGLLALRKPEEQWVQLPIVDTTQCAESYAQFSLNSRTTVQISDKQLCAQGSKNNDACQGDSGGPLMVQFNDRYTMIGLVSFGPRTCGVNNLPGVYTRISSYNDWISANVQP